MLLLLSLVKKGLLEQNTTTVTYKIGPTLYELGNLYLGSIDIIKAAKPVTETLNDLTGEAVLLGTFNGSGVLVILKEESQHTFRFARPIGSIVPAYAKAIGKAFLSELTNAEIDNLYPEEELQLTAPKTIATKTELKLSLEQIRNTEVSFTDEESGKETAAVASLIRDATSKAVASMTIPVQTFKRTQANRSRLATLVKMGCSLISYRLGYQGMAEPVRGTEEIRSWFERNQLDTLMYERKQPKDGFCQGRDKIKAGAGAPPVAVLGIIGQVASCFWEACTYFCTINVNYSKFIGLTNDNRGGLT